MATTTIKQTVDEHDVVAFTEAVEKLKLISKHS
jgi:hypothetical protein